MFESKIDMRSRKAMVKFLMEHFRYDTMNSWNQCTSYANNVKLYNLNIDKDLMNKAYDFIDAECDDYQFEINDAINTFEIETGYTVGFNGRSSGYIVLYDADIDKDGKRFVRISSIDRYEDFEDWSLAEIKKRVKLVQRFDALCDEMRDIFINYVTISKIETVEILIPKKKTIATIGE